LPKRKGSGSATKKLLPGFFLIILLKTGVNPYRPAVSKAIRPANVNPCPSATNIPGWISTLLVLLPVLSDYKRNYFKGETCFTIFPKINANRKAHSIRFTEVVNRGIAYCNYWMHYGDKSCNAYWYRSGLLGKTIQATDLHFRNHSNNGQ
jgi:hypothetical protein